MCNVAFGPLKNMPSWIATNNNYLYQLQCVFSSSKSARHVSNEQIVWNSRKTLPTTVHGFLTYNPTTPHREGIIFSPVWVDLCEPFPISRISQQCCECISNAGTSINCPIHSVLYGYLETGVYRHFRTGFELTTVEVTCTDCTGNCKSSYYTITTSPRI